MGRCTETTELAHSVAIQFIWGYKLLGSLGRKSLVSVPGSGSNTREVQARTAWKSAWGLWSVAVVWINQEWSALCQGNWPLWVDKGSNCFLEKRNCLTRLLKNAICIAIYAVPILLFTQSEPCLSWAQAINYGIVCHSAILGPSMDLTHREFLSNLALLLTVAIDTLS